MMTTETGGLASEVNEKVAAAESLAFSLHCKICLTSRGLVLDIGFNPLRPHKGHRLSSPGFLNFLFPPVCVEDGNSRSQCADPACVLPVLRTIVTDVTFVELGVAEPLLRALATENYTHPTPIQAHAIPPLLAGRDLLGIAQTGTGKTAAFGLPLLQRLSIGHVPPRPREARGADPGADARTRDADPRQPAHLWPIPQPRRAVILGGVSQNAQVKAMKHGVDILVATPGRLLDLVQQKHIRLDAVSGLHRRRSRPHARHGLHPRCAQDRGASAARAPVDAVLRHHARRHRQAGGRHAASPVRIEVAPQARPPTASSRSSITCRCRRSGSC